MSNSESRQLRYLPLSELDRARRCGDPHTAARLFAACCRINVLYMIARAGSGHIGSSFSCMDILSWLYLNELDGTGNVFFSSKGHDAPAMYAHMIAMGQLDFDLLHRLRRLGGLPGHPDVRTPHVVTNTGSLGMGISKAKGMAAANRLKGKTRRIFVLTGDGELQEGQIWESLTSAVRLGLGEITVIVDHNKVQSDSFVTETSGMDGLEEKFQAFGWDVIRIDGHGSHAIEEALAWSASRPATPTCVIADTVKGRGVSFMEHTCPESMDRTEAGYFYAFHSGAPTVEAYEAALTELVGAADAILDGLGEKPLALETVAVKPPVPPAKTQRLIPAYGEALLAQAAGNPDLVALDADLLKDCGLADFKAAHPDRFFECGIAEMDMVSTAGGMALSGLLPVVHSFACFLTPRANEQIHNNATEGTRIVYVGSLAGLVPGGPGHSHQAVRDMASLSGIPGLTMMEPCCEKEVGILLDHCCNKAAGPTYLRLVSIPCELDFEYDPAPLAEGCGAVIREGNDLTVIGYGPVLLNEAYRAILRLEKEHGVKARLVNLPWLNRVDKDWLLGVAGESPRVVTLDNHVPDGGQGRRLGLALAGSDAKVLHLGPTGVPVCGLNSEVLAHHRLDADSILADILTFLEARHG